MGYKNQQSARGLLEALQEAVEALRDHLSEEPLVHLNFSARLGDVSISAQVDLSEEVKEEG